MEDRELKEREMKIAENAAAISDHVHNDREAFKQLYQFATGGFPDIWVYVAECAIALADAECKAGDEFYETYEWIETTERIGAKILIGDLKEVPEKLVSMVLYKMRMFTIEPKHMHGVGEDRGVETCPESEAEFFGLYKKDSDDENGLPMHCKDFKTRADAEQYLLENDNIDPDTIARRIEILEYIGQKLEWLKDVTEEEKKDLIDGQFCFYNDDNNVELTTIGQLEIEGN